MRGTRQGNGARAKHDQRRERPSIKRVAPARRSRPFRSFFHGDFYCHWVPYLLGG